MKRIMLLLLLITTNVFSQTGEEIDKANSYYSEGLNLTAEQKYYRAILSFSKAVEIAPNYSHAYYKRGLCYKHLEKYTTAIKDFKEGIELDTNYPENYFEIANCYIKTEKYDLAYDYYSLSIEYDYNAYNERGDCNMRLKKYEKALKDYTKAISLEKDDFILIGLYRDRAYAKRGLGDETGLKKTIKKQMKKLNLFLNSSKVR